MNCKIRRWELSDARDLATALSNKKIQDNLRDGLPYPYTEQDGKEFISAMRAKSPTFAFLIFFILTPRQILIFLTVRPIGICQYYNCLISLAITATSFAFVSIIMVSNV